MKKGFAAFLVPGTLILANPASLSGDTVLAIQEDKSGSLWVGTRLDWPPSFGHTADSPIRSSWPSLGERDPS